MSPKKIVILTIFILSIIAFASWCFVIFKNRYSNNDITTENISTENKTPEENSNIDLPDTSKPAGQESNGETQPTTSAPEKTPLVEIEKEDCLNGCKRFSENQELAYCKQFCGAADVPNNADNCNEKTGLEKDYCFKDLAVKNQDFDACEKITDKGIKKTCITRITEDILDKQIK